MGFQFINFHKNILKFENVWMIRIKLIILPDSFVKKHNKNIQVLSIILYVSYPNLSYIVKVSTRFNQLTLYLKILVISVFILSLTDPFQINIFYMKKGSTTIQPFFVFVFNISLSPALFWSKLQKSFVRCVWLQQAINSSIFEIKSSRYLSPT